MLYTSVIMGNKGARDSLPGSSPRINFGLENSAINLLIPYLYNAKVLEGRRSRTAFSTRRCARVACFAGGWLVHVRGLQTLDLDRDR